MRFAGVRGRVYDSRGNLAREVARGACWNYNITPIRKAGAGEWPTHG